MARCLLRAFSADELFLIPERSIRRTKGWCSCSKCGSCGRGNRIIVGRLIWTCRLWRFTFFSSEIINCSLRTLNWGIVCFAKTSQSKSIPDLVLSTRSTTLYIYIIKRMLFRTNLATQSLIIPNRSILRTSRRSS